MSRLSHPHIVRFYAATFGHDSARIVVELLTCTLSKAVHDSKRAQMMLSRADMERIALEIASGAQ